MNWRETGLPKLLSGHDGRLVIQVRTIRIGPAGWSVVGSIANHTRTALRLLPYGHEHERTGFGLVATRTGRVSELHSANLPPPVLAERLRPVPPRALLAGERWSGAFSGPQPIARGSYVHVAFGQLGVLGHRLEFISDHSYRVR